MRNIKIIGCGNALPDNKVMFGNQERYRMTAGQNLLDLVEVAVENALADASLTIDDIDCIVGGMATPLQGIPCNAALIHERIANDNMDIPAMDINTSCTSFLTALDIVAYMIDCGKYKNVLIVSGDTASAALNPNQKESYELFSDATTAFIVTKSDGNSGVIYSAQKTWSSGAHDTEIRGGCGLMPAFVMTDQNREDYYFDMKGKKVLKLCAKKLPAFFEDCFSKAEISQNEIDIAIPHQASRALKMIMSKLGFREDDYIDEVPKYGNMISASVPFILCEAIHKGKIKRGDIVLLMGTAAGLTANFLLLKY